MNDYELNIVKGVTLSPPVIGKITLGHTEFVELNGELCAQPVADDHFGLTTLSQDKETRVWNRHPLEASLADEGKLTQIPVRIAYNNPKLNLVNRFSVFDPLTGRVLCAGNGENARRVTDEGVKAMDCPRPEGCRYGRDAHCKSMSRAYFRVEGCEDELGVFALRTTSWNSLAYLGIRLTELAALTGNKIAGMPMMLVVRDKTSSLSYREPFYFADLVTRPGQTLLSAIKEARDYQSTLADAGLSLENMEKAVLAGLANGGFADEIDDVDEWLSHEAFVAAASADNAPLDDSMTKLAQNLQNLVAATIGSTAIDDVSAKHDMEPESASVTQLAAAQTPLVFDSASRADPMPEELAGSSAHT